MDWPEAAQKGELWAAVINLVLLAVIFFTRKWWRWSGDGAGPPTDTPHVITRRWFWAQLTATILLAGAMRWKFAHGSLWWDEVWNVRHATVGDFKPDKKRAGEFKFYPSTWAQALWNYKKPTNHPPFTVASKICHTIWAAESGAPEGTFDEFVIRFPNFIASLASVAMMALLLRAWGFPGAGLIAATFLALHPWHIRYGIDGRAYSFLLLATLVGCFALSKMLGDGNDGPSGKARWWWIFGAMQALIMWCHALSVWVCAALAAAAAILIWKNQVGEDRRRALARLAVVNVAGAMLFLQLFLPNLLQAAHWGEKNRDGNLLDAAYFKTTVGQLASGQDFPKLAPHDYLNFDFLAGIPVHEPHRDWVAFQRPELATRCLIAGFCFGLVALRRRSTAGFITTVTHLISAVIFLIVVAASHLFFYHRFMIALLVPVCVLPAMGLAWVFSGALGYLRGPKLFRRLGGLTLILMMLRACYVWWWAVEYQIIFLRDRSYAPLREVTEYLRMKEPDARIFGYGLGGEALFGYWTKIEVLKEAPLRPKLEEALASGKPVYVALGYEEFNRSTYPDGFSLLDDRAVFSRWGGFYGIDPMFHFSVFEAKPRPAPLPPR